MAFLLGDQVLVIPIGGGTARQLLNGQTTSWLLWTPAGQLLASDIDGNRLHWLDAAGGAPRSKPITRCAWGGEWVESLKQLLCSANRIGLFVDPENGKQWTVRLDGSDGVPGKIVAGSAFRLIDGRYLVYLAVDGSLVAAKFDAATHTAGKAVALVSGMRREAIGEGQFDLSANGSLVYSPGVDGTRGRMVRLRPGKEPEPLPIELADFQRFDLSRDGRWFVAAVQGPVDNELRQYDLRNGQQFTWLRGEYVRQPLWDANGEEVMVAMRDFGRWTILKGAPSSGSQPDTVLTGPDNLHSPDPINYHDDHLGLAQDWAGSVVFRFDPAASHPTFDTVVTGARFASLSPSGTLLLYQTTEANRVVVTSFPKPGRRWQLASEGLEPIWLSPTEALFRLGVSWFVVRINPDNWRAARATHHLGTRPPLFRYAWLVQPAFA